MININLCIYPVIWEVFVHNLSHFGLLVVKDFRIKVEDDVEHAGLCGQGGGAVLGEGVGRDLVVDVVRS